MSAPFVHFERLEVRSLPGIPTPGMTIDGLCPGVNVVYGPNASGKSRTAHALMLVLWPKASRGERASLRGRLLLDAETWILDLDAGAVSCQREGVDTDLPPLPPAEVRERYRLELHDLVRSEGVGLATAIAQESVGGYDVDGACRSLGFDDRIPSTRKEADRVKERRETLRGARDAHATLLDEERRLDSLRSERERASADQQRAAVLTLAIERVELLPPLVEAKTSLDGFPDGMDRVVGTEAERLEKLRGEQRELASRRRDVEAALARAKVTVAASSLPEDGLPHGTVRALRDHLDELLKIGQAEDSRRQDVVKAVAQRTEARQHIGATLTDEQLEALDLGGLQDLSEFAREAQQLHAERSAAAALRSWLGESDPDPDLDRVRVGIQALRRWLNEGTTSAPQVEPLWKALLTAAGLTLAAAVIALALVADLSWLLVFAPVGLIPLYAAWRRPRATFDARASHQREYRKTGLDEPSHWDEANVEHLLARHQEHEARGMLDEERAHRLAGMKGELEALDARAAKLEARRAGLIERLGVAPDTDEHSLYWLVSHLLRWGQASADLAAARAKLEEADAKRRDEMQAINHALAPFGLAAPQDIIEARRVVDELDERAKVLQGAIDELKRSRDALADLDARAAATDDELRGLFARAGLEVGEDAALVERCERRADYRAAVETAFRCQQSLELAEKRLRAHPAFDEALLQRPQEDLQASLAAISGAARAEQEAHDEIVRIQDRVDLAKRAHGVEEALTALREAKHALAERRDQDRNAVAGGVLSDWLTEQSRDRDRPRVFHRARELLMSITRGRYRLEIEDGSPPRFRAFDTVREQGLELDQLSSGTRVQLLLAVRVAFVETQEQGARPPLVLDETLANSDDARARAIIEATFELARAGRQVFYFTAQHDEVGKFRTLLSEAGDVPHRLVDLQQVRRLSEAESSEELPRLPPPAVPVQPPGDRSYEEYGRALEIPLIDPRRPIGAVHVWHLLDDTHQLHRLLVQGIQRWGPLKHMLARGGAPLLGEDPGAQQRVEAAARAIHAVCEDWRVGRGRPVDRQALVDSAAVTPKPLPRVAEIAAEVNGDARALLLRLETARVSGLGPVGIQRARERLEKHGYLDPTPLLSRGEIRARALGAMSREIEERLIDATFLDRTLDNLVEIPVDQV